MILRDAVFSSERHHLGAQPASPAPAPDAVHEPSASYEVRPVAAPALSSDHVASWLVTQDGATRTALAAMLSEELAAVREAARAEGYAHGHGEAMKEARDRVGSSLTALEALNESAEQAFAAEAAHLGDACTDIVAEVFFKLAGTRLAAREVIVGAVTEVLKRVREERELRIHVSPLDLAVLRSAEAGIAASLPGRRFTLVEDNRIEVGGCIVESALGSLDGRLEVQLAEFCATLRTVKISGAGA